MFSCGHIRYNTNCPICFREVNLNTKRRLCAYCGKSLEIGAWTCKSKECSYQISPLNNFAIPNRVGKRDDGPVTYTSHKVDPKQAQATKKMTFDNVPISLLLHATAGNDDGARKYGPWNWLKLEDGSMSLTTYLNALQRHLILYRAGQDNTSDTNIHNLDSMIAGLAVLRDAQLFNKVRDDRIKLSEEQITTLEKILNKEV